MFALEDVKPLIDKAYVRVKLTVMESEKFKADENPHGMDVLKDLGGEGQGAGLEAALESPRTR